jgi:hypothetical protein
VFKDFLRFHVACSTGRIEERLYQVIFDHFYTTFCKSYGTLTGNTFEEDDKEEIRQMRNLSQLLRVPVADYLRNSGL